MLSKNQLIIMLQLQSEMNATVNPDWLNAGYPFLRAVLVESAEAMEHHGWKWWKHQTTDMAQLQMELVDIWHFALSHWLVNNSAIPTLDRTAEAIAWYHDRVQDSTIVLDGVEWVIGQEATGKAKPVIDVPAGLTLMMGLAGAERFEPFLFGWLLEKCQMSWDELFRQYVAKNVLNIFRQHYGYKEGHYQKIWQDREDNEHLVDIMAELDASSAEFRELLYSSLEQRYKQLCISSR